MWMWCFFRIVPSQNIDQLYNHLFSSSKNDWSPGSLVGKTKILFIVLSLLRKFQTVVEVVQEMSSIMENRCKYNDACFEESSTLQKPLLTR
jgi:hypothetical protein